MFYFKKTRKDFDLVLPLSLYLRLKDFLLLDPTDLNWLDCNKIHLQLSAVRGVMLMCGNSVNATEYPVDHLTQWARTGNWKHCQRRFSAFLFFFNECHFTTSLFMESFSSYLGRKIPMNYLLSFAHKEAQLCCQHTSESSYYDKILMKKQNFVLWFYKNISSAKCSG